MEALRTSEDHIVRLDNAKRALAGAFLGWQCRMRQIAFRQNEGRPSSGLTPEVFSIADGEPLGHIVTVLNKIENKTPVMEFQHIYRRTRDPSQRRSDVIKYLSESYFQKPSSFSDRLTSVFPPGSQQSADIESIGHCRLVFQQFKQSYELVCDIERLQEHEILFQSTFWHNALFNSNLSKDSNILAFVPDWSLCSADPAPARRTAV